MTESVVADVSLLSMGIGVDLLVDLSLPDIYADAVMPAAVEMVSAWAARPVPATQGRSQCGQTATLISKIQGRQAESPLVGRSHTVEAVVTGVFLGKERLRGFFLQEEAADQDDDPLTSEGLFVFDGPGKLQVQVGDQVRVSGTVAEFGGMTQLGQLSAFEVCATGQAFDYQTLSLPLTSEVQLEAREGMAVALSQTLTVVENHQVGRFGELVLSLGRLYIPTQLVAPGTKARALQQANRLNRLILDDGSTRQNPPLIAYPVSGLTAANTVRTGDQVRALKAVVAEGFGNYRLHPLAPVQIHAANPRPSQPQLPGVGNLKVASFNLLNFFNGDGAGQGFPAPRGASSVQELERQRAKTVAALHALNAEIIGLVEIENDGYGEASTIQDLVRALNKSSQKDRQRARYRFVRPNSRRLGQDEITVALIYDSSKVRPVGAAATLATPPFDRNNRQPLVQTFELLKNGARLTVAVNHFKSKNCGKGASAGDHDADDGQGCWNRARTDAAKQLAQWLATNPTGSGNGHTLIIGDLNAYAQEDPLRALAAAGYQDLFAQFSSGANSDNPYTYVYYGQAGYLDHALASRLLLPQVTGVTAWHINADEPPVLDYNLEFKSSQQHETLYRPDPFRSSDHDPVVVEFNLLP